MFYLLGLEFDYPQMTIEDKKIYENYITAKSNKDFETSDKLRILLLEKGLL